MIYLDCLNRKRLKVVANQNPIAYYILQISYVIPQEVIPGRIALLVTILLCMTNIFINVTSKSPNTKSINSISAWIMACVFFVYSALLEYGCILLYKYLTRSFNVALSAKKFLTHVDLVCLSISFCSFIVFNLIFWSVQLLL